MPTRPRTVICENCGRVETFHDVEEWHRSDWEFGAGDICPQCHADNVKHRRTNQDAERDDCRRQKGTR